MRTTILIWEKMGIRRIHTEFKIYAVKNSSPNRKEETSHLRAGSIRNYRIWQTIKSWTFLRGGNSRKLSVRLSWHFSCGYLDNEQVFRSTSLSTNQQTGSKQGRKEMHEIFRRFLSLSIYGFACIIVMQRLRLILRPSVHCRVQTEECRGNVDPAHNEYILNILHQVQGHRDGQKGVDPRMCDLVSWLSLTTVRVPVTQVLPF